MKLRKLKIEHYKNLQDFEIEFGEKSFRTVLLGQNGTGKSNLLEALTIIFRDLDLGVSPAFSYVLDYECRNNEIHIEANHMRARLGEQVQIMVKQPDGLQKKVPYNKKFSNDPERIYLPSYIFGYYSGPSNRMEKHFDTHQNLFYQEQLKGKEEPRRPLFYARSEQNQFALLAFFVEEEDTQDDGTESVREFLKNLLGIEELISVLFILHEPPWHSKQGDPRFWNARGVLKDFLEHLYNTALAPMRRNVRVKPEFAVSTTLEHLYFYLRGEQNLKDLFDYYKKPQLFFKALESTYISKVLSEVRIRFTKHDVKTPLTFLDLSEGEQQLLMVLGLLRLTKEEEALFLLDEPDTHLNPAWSIRYLDYMDRVVGRQITSQVIMTTHNPLVIAGMKREDVRIMQRDSTHGTIFVEQPRENPRGMGVAGILTSEMFGLRSALDLPTQQMLDEQRVLAAKKELTQQQRHRLGELTEQLDQLGFMSMEDDPLYAEFTARFIQRENASIRDQVTLTPEQQEERMQLVDEIISELIAEGRW